MRTRIHSAAITLTLALCAILCAKDPPPDNKPAPTEPVPLRSVFFSPDGKTLAASESFIGNINATSGDIVLWDIATAKHLNRPHAPQPTGSIKFSQDSKTLILGDSTNWSFYDVGTGKITRPSEPGPASSIEGFSPDGRTELLYQSRTVAKGEEEVSGPLITKLKSLNEPFDDSKGSKATPLEGVDSAGEFRFSPDSRLLAIATNAKKSNVGKVLLWEVASRRLLNTLTAESKAKLQFSPDGAILAVIGDHAVQLVDPASGKARDTLSTAASEAHDITGLSFSPDGKTIVGQVYLDAVPPSRQKGHAFRLWSTASGKRLLELHASDNVDRHLVFSSDSQTLTGVCCDKAADTSSAKIWDIIRRWDTSTGKADTFPIPAAMQSPGRPTLSPDGKLLGAAFTDGTVKLWTIGPDATQIKTFGPLTHEVPAERRYKTISEGSKMVTQGTKVFLRDANGKTTPMPDGDYKMSNHIMHIRGGEKVTNN